MTKQADICFVLDATESTQIIFAGMIEHVNDIACELKRNYSWADFKFAAVIYRDPIDYREPIFSPLSDELKAELDASKKKHEDERIKYIILKDLYDEDIEAQKKEYAKQIDLFKYPINKNVAIPFTHNIECLEQELMKVKCEGGNDDPEDWVGALTLALEDLSWREKSKKCIIWISDANAHGKRYCGYDNHNEEEPKLEPLVRQMANNNIYFVGINITIYDDVGCQRTLNEMREIYSDEYDSRCFIIENFKPSYEEIVAGNGEWPEVVLDNLMGTVSTSINKFIHEKL